MTEKSYSRPHRLPDFKTPEKVHWQGHKKTKQTIYSFFKTRQTFSLFN
jgi:hypothetical protein